LFGSLSQSIKVPMSWKQALRSSVFIWSRQGRSHAQGSQGHGPGHAKFLSNLPIWLSDLALGPAKYSSLFSSPTRTKPRRNERLDIKWGRLVLSAWLGPLAHARFGWMCAPPLQYLRPAGLAPRAASSPSALEVWKPGTHPSPLRPPCYVVRPPSQDYASPSQSSTHDSSTAPPLHELGSSNYDLIDLCDCPELSWFILLSIS
jgi:hypothetical protein